MQLMRCEERVNSFLRLQILCSSLLHHYPVSVEVPCKIYDSDHKITDGHKKCFSLVHGSCRKVFFHPPQVIFLQIDDIIITKNSNSGLNIDSSQPGWRRWEGVCLHRLDLLISSLLSLKQTSEKFW